MKLHAGHAIVAAMAAFILIMTQFMVRAYHNQETLVAEDYYAQELRYQEQIDKLQNVKALGEDVRFEVRPGRLELNFPSALHGRKISGELFLMRPDNERGDLRVPLNVDAEGRSTVDTGNLLKGAYSLHLEWAADGVAYLTEDRVHIQ